MSLGLYRESLDLQKDGAPVAVGDSVFWLRRSGTKQYYETRRRIIQKLFGLHLQPKPEDESEINSHILCDYTVANWGSVFDEDGEAVEFSESNARHVFLDPEYRLSLNTILVNHSWDFGNYLKLNAEEDLENLKKK